MTDLTQALIIILVIVNASSFILYGYDKARAKRGARRVPERSLITMAALFGAAGALLGMELFRHKTRKKLFTTCVPLFLGVQVIIAILYFTLWA